jgi:fumarate hydratase subunit alpha
MDEAIRRGVERATEEVPLRPNAVDPITRKNPGNNVGEHMPSITYELSDSPFIEFRVMPKGAGSENMSALKMLNPSQGVKGIKEFVLEAVKAAGSKPCPPTVIGVGVGGTADLALKLAKRAAMRPIGKRHPDTDIADMERDLKRALNQLGIGPMGLGGKTTVLDVMVEKAYCHTATLPVGVNFTCYAARRHGMRIDEKGGVEMLED